MRRILFVITVLLTSCTTNAPLPTVAPLPTSTPNPYATWTPTPGMGAQGVIIRQTELAFQQTRGAYEAGVAQATQSYQLTKDAQAIKERELMLEVTKQSITQQAQANALSFEMTKASATQQGRAAVAATLKQQDDDNWWWWVKSLAAIILIGALGWVIVQVGEAWRSRLVNDNRQVRVVRTGNTAIILLANGRREYLQLTAPQIASGEDMHDAQPVEDDEDVSDGVMDNARVVFNSEMPNKRENINNRSLALRWLSRAIELNGLESSMIPSWRKMQWDSETWQRAKSLFDCVESSQGVGTWVSGRYKTLGELRQAVAEKRYTPSPILDHSPTPNYEPAESGVL